MKILCKRNQPLRNSDLSLPRFSMRVTFACGIHEELVHLKVKLQILLTFALFLSDTPCNGSKQRFLHFLCKVYYPIRLDNKNFIIPMYGKRLKIYSLSKLFAEPLKAHLETF